MLILGMVGFLRPFGSDQRSNSSFLLLPSASGLISRFRMASGPTTRAYLLRTQSLANCSQVKLASRRLCCSLGFVVSCMLLLVSEVWRKTFVPAL